MHFLIFANHPDMGMFCYAGGTNAMNAAANNDYVKVVHILESGYLSFHNCFNMEQISEVSTRSMP